MKQKIFFIGFIALCSLLLSLGLRGYYQEWNQRPEGETTRTKQAVALKGSISPSPTGTGAVQNIAAWSRYTYNNQFSIAYPPFWNVVADKDSNGVSFMTNSYHQDDEFSMPYGNSYDVSYAIFGQNDISDMDLKNGDQFPSDTSSETMEVTNLKHLQIDGLPAVEFDYYPTDNVNFVRTRVSILKNNTMYRFNATYALDANKQLFDQMMQSLKFF